MFRIGPQTTEWGDVFGPCPMRSWLRTDVLCALSGDQQPVRNTAQILPGFRTTLGRAIRRWSGLHPRLAFHRVAESEGNGRSA